MTTHHPDRFNIDEFMQTSMPHHLGFANQIQFNSPIIVTDEGDLAFVAVESGTNDIYAWRWNATATTDDILVVKGQIPLNFNPQADKFKIRLWARKVDTAGTGNNADLAMTFSMIVLGASDTEPRTITIANHVLTEVAATDHELSDFELIELDLSDENLQPGEHFSLAISVNEAVGTALRVDLLSIDALYWGSVSFYNSSLRRW